MPRKSKKAVITETRREYNLLTRAYRAAGKKALGKKTNSTVQKDYRAIKRERARVGSRLGRLTGAHKGR